MKIDGVSIRVGNVLEHKGKLWVVTKTQHVKPGKGGAFNQVEMKCITDGTKLNERFRSDETVEKVRLDQVDYQYLYADGNDLVLMHPENYEQVHVPASLLEDRLPFTPVTALTRHLVRQHIYENVVNVEPLSAYRIFN